jgi:hypothetical protein
MIWRIPVRDLDDEEPYTTSKFHVSANNTATAWAFAVMMIVIAIIVAACCVGSVYIVRTT